MKKRVLLAGLSHQTNTLVGGRTSLEDFEIRRGEEMLRVGEASPSAGVLEVAVENDWEVLPVVDVRAMPGPTVSDAVVDLFWAELKAVSDAEAAKGIDGIFLVLHGAMASESLADVEGEMLRRIRGIDHLADAPICGVFDLHANFTEAMARQSDGLIACRKNPPTDAKEAATDAALLLEGLMRTEERPATVWEHPPVMWPPGATATASEPMLTLEGRAREMEEEVSDILTVNVLSGFPYADIPETGVSFSAITTGDLELARAGLRELNVLASAQREAGNRSGMSLEEAIMRLQGHSDGPILLLEPSDSVLAGAPGDGTRVLRALVESGVPDTGVIVNDPEAVRRLWEMPMGRRCETVIGGNSGEAGSEPLPLEAEVMHRSDGRFMPEAHSSCLAYSVDDEVDMGRCAVIRAGGVTILLTSRRTPPFDLGQWRSQGVEPEKLFAIGIKAAVEHRPAYDPIARESYTIDLPGPCAQNLRRLPFERVSRPVYPLDSL